MIHINGNSKSSLYGVQNGDIQPNATDLRIGKVFKIRDSIFIIDEEQKVHRGSDLIEVGEDGYWELDVGSYEVVMQNKIKIAHGEAGWVIGRSTLTRNGVILHSSLYDAGYGDNTDDGAVMVSLLQVTVAPMKLKQGTRIGQYLCFSSETLRKYDGDYGKVGHDDKYK